MLCPGFSSARNSPLRNLHALFIRLKRDALLPTAFLDPPHLLSYKQATRASRVWEPFHIPPKHISRTRNGDSRLPRTGRAPHRGSPVIAASLRSAAHRQNAQRDVTTLTCRRFNPFTTEQDG